PYPVPTIAKREFALRPIADVEQHDPILLNRVHRQHRTQQRRSHRKSRRGTSRKNRYKADEQYRKYVAIPPLHSLERGTKTKLHHRTMLIGTPPALRIIPRSAGIQPLTATPSQVASISTHVGSTSSTATML